MADKSQMFTPVAGGKAKPAAGIQQAWTPLVPVPDDAPPPPEAHYKLGIPDVIWTYRDEQGRVMGYILRFDEKGAEKSFYPLTYCRHADSGKQDWRWKSWDVPRPLYGLDRLQRGMVN